MPVARWRRRIEAAIQSSGLEWTFLRSQISAANALRWWGPAIRTNSVIQWPHLLVETSPIHERDIAAAAVCALCEDTHCRAEYVLTGPESLTQLEQISIIGRVIGRELRIKELSSEAAANELGARFSRAVAKMLLDAWEAAAGLPAFLSTTVQDLTGMPPRTFAEWVGDMPASSTHN